MPDVRNVQDGDTLSTWFASIPPVTRYWLVSCTLVTLGCGIGLIDPRLVILDWRQILHGWQLWRLLTCFLFLGSLGFGFLFNLLFIYQYSSALEKNVFQGRTADYLWMFVVVGSALLIVSATVLRTYVLGPALLMAVTHIWSRHFPTMRVTIFFFTVPAAYLSFALLALTLLMGGGLDLSGAAGMICGHLYYFLDSVYPFLPGNQGQKPLQTPALFARLVGGRPVPSRGLRRDASDTTSRVSLSSLTGGHRWGTGQRLGSQENSSGS
ncbi:hypothetical protein CDCA_CDCA01G0231 [Cyanidium caldarium]|uniref:Derlin n=1 Tax=Cyanidium caldarium TaxID=2771 RepID=A0AAV9IQ35_CYACA|nr:hypothetical protein CDCA_CDCA01G0231 [Cyanidium caldarium]